jgi:hypothetical protein
MTEYLHTYNLVIDREQGTQLPDGSWAQEVTLVLLDAPGTDTRPVAITLTAAQARELGFELLAAAEHAQRTTTIPQPEGDQ